MVVNMHEEGERLLVVEMAGAMLKNDGEAVSSVIERLIADHSPIRVLFDICKFRGWDQDAIAGLTDVSASRYQTVDRIAVLGDRKWERPWKELCKAFTAVTILFFEPHQASRAYAWLVEKDDYLTRSNKPAYTQ